MGAVLANFSEFRLRPLGSRRPLKRLPSKVFGTSSSDSETSRFRSVEVSEKRDSDRACPTYVGHRSNRTGGRSSISRFLQPTLPSSESFWGLVSGNRFISTKSLLGHSDLQDGDRGEDTQLSPTELLGDLARSEGCVLPYSDAPGLSEVPQIPDRRPVLSVLSSPLRHFDSPVAVYESQEFLFLGYQFNLVNYLCTPPRSRFRGRTPAFSLLDSRTSKPKSLLVRTHFS